MEEVVTGMGEKIEEGCWASWKRYQMRRKKMPGVLLREGERETKID